jgi:ribonuclease J
VLAATVDIYEKTLASPPQIATRGFVYVKDNEDLIEEIMRVATESLVKNVARGADLATAQARLKDDVAKFLFNKIRRRPVIMPMLVEAE